VIASGSVDHYAVLPIGATFHIVTFSLLIGAAFRIAAF